MKTRTTRPTRPFGRKLAAIRDHGEDQRRRELHRRADASLKRAEAIVTALHQVEQTEELIRHLALELAEELSPNVRVSRRFFDGRWMVSLRLDEEGTGPGGSARRFPSQVAFLLDPRAQTSRPNIECRATVRGRDLPVEGLAAALMDENRASLAAFVERCLLAFAAAWLDRTQRAAPPAGLATA